MDCASWPQGLRSSLAAPSLAQDGKVCSAPPATPIARLSPQTSHERYWARLNSSEATVANSNLRAGALSIMETYSARFYESGHEVLDLAMTIQAENMASAKARFSALWRACSELADFAALVDDDGRVVWGAEHDSGRSP